MRLIARLALGPLLILTTLLGVGCEEAPIGARCESVNDCDRTGAGTTRACYSFTNTSQPCSGSGVSCVCCPVPSMRVPGVTPAVCTMTASSTDTGVMVDATSVDSANEDSGLSTDASAD
jgi:hypothetical protein